MSDGLLNLAAVAARLGCSRTTAWRLVDSGAIPSIQITSSLRRVDADDLERFIDERRSRGPVADVVPLRTSRKGAPSVRPETRGPALNGADLPDPGLKDFA